MTRFYDLRDAAGQVLATDDGAGLQSTIALPLTDGTYYIEVSNDGEYGNLGEYTVTLDGVDQLPAFANPVALNSNPGAPVTFYLGFAGGVIPGGDPLLAARTDGGSGDIPVNPYDTDGNIGIFSNEEIDEITEIWARVAEDFRPFDVNVTTVNPGPLNDNQDAAVLIGGDGSFLNLPIDYTASSNAFSDISLDNTGYVFSEAIFDSFSSQQQQIAYHASAAIGTMLGLEPHSNYIGGFLLNTYDPGDVEIAPIMGAPQNALRDTWANAPTPTPGVTQDDLLVITNTFSNNIRFRTDDHQDTLGGATIISIGSGDEVIAGIIEQNDDADLFRFDTLATTATISVAGLDLTTQFAGVTNPGSNLDPVLELLDANGVVLETSDIPFTIPNGKRSLTGEITRDIPAGTYYIRVGTDGDYGNLGEYNITLGGVDVVPVTIDIDPDTFAETDGLQQGVGRVSRPVGQLGNTDLVVELASLDTSEVTVPAQVTIPGGSLSTTFDITIQDDTLLDGDQRVGVQAILNGVVNAVAFVSVTDVETIELQISPDPIPENSGTASLTVRRSNTDVFAPNHWVSSGNNLLEYSPAGALVRTVPVEWFGGGTRPNGQNVRDIVLMENGRVAVYNGTDTAGLSIFNPDLDQWEHFGPIQGLSSNPLSTSTGGLATVGDYVFLTDQEAFPDDLHGMVRVNTATGEIDRFGEGTIGARLFAMATGFTSTIYELDPIDGSLLNTIQLPFIPGSTRRYFTEAIAFDGTDLWALSSFFSSTSGFEEVIRVDANTGALLETHPLNVIQNTALDGLAELNGNLYIVDNIGNIGSFGMEIEVYDPATRQATGGILAVDSVNGINASDIIGSLPKSNLLLATDDFNNVIYQLNPQTGRVVTSFTAANRFGFFEPGITSVGDVAFGGIQYSELIYIESSAGNIDLYTTTGTRVDADPTTPAVDGIIAGVAFSGPIAGNDVPGVSTADLRFRDVTIGLDGRLYGLLEDGDEISIHDPRHAAETGGDHARPGCQYHRSQ